MGIGAVEKGKIGELYVFSELIRRGAMPFQPIADISGVEAVVQRKDGTYVEMQIKTTWTEEMKGYFNVPDLVARKNLFIVGLIMGETTEAWIIPSEIFAENTGKRRLLSLGLRETNHQLSLREKLAEYSEAWNLLTG